MIAAFFQLQIYNSKQKFQFSPFTDITSEEYLYDTRGAASAASVCVGLLPGMEHSYGILVCVLTCNKKIDQKVQTTKDGQKPKEVINMSIVQVRGIHPIFPCLVVMVVTMVTKRVLR